MLEPGHVIAERYSVRRKIGQGSRSIVYEAQDLRLRSIVALKEVLIDPGSEAALAREVQILAELRHPTLNPINDYVVATGRHFLVSPFIRGEDLAEMLAWRTNPPPLRQVLDWAAQLLTVLSYLHQQQPPIIHRAIRPRNLKLVNDNLIALDFGLISSSGVPRSYALHYLSPEHFHGSDGDPRSDLYSLAATIYHLVTRTPPADAATRTAAILNGQADPLRLPRLLNPTVPESLGAILMQALQLKLADRPHNAQQFLAHIQAGNVPPERTILQSRPMPAPQRIPADDPLSELETERRRIATMIRQQIDDPLALLLAQIAAYEQALGHLPAVQAAFRNLSSLAREVLQQTRDLDENLQAAALDTLGLASAIELLAAQIARNTGIQLTIQIERAQQRGPRRVELAAYRAVQDALERATQTAQATWVQVKLGGTMEWLEAHVRDDGIFSAASEVLRTAGQQIGQLGGSLNIQPGPQAGTLVQIRLPVQQIELTHRERAVLRLVAEGLTNKQIAAALQVTPRTVNFHLDNIYGKLGVRSRTEAAVYALRYLT